LFASGGFHITPILTDYKAALGDSLNNNCCLI